MGLGLSWHPPPWACLDPCVMLTYPGLAYGPRDSGLCGPRSRPQTPRVTSPWDWLSRGPCGLVLRAHTHTNIHPLSCTHAWTHTCTHSAGGKRGRWKPAPVLCICPLATDQAARGHVGRDSATAVLPALRGASEREVVSGEAHSVHVLRKRARLSSVGHKQPPGPPKDEGLRQWAVLGGQAPVPIGVTGELETFGIKENWPFIYHCPQVLLQLVPTPASKREEPSDTPSCSRPPCPPAPQAKSLHKPELGISGTPCPDVRRTTVL